MESELLRLGELSLTLPLVFASLQPLAGSKAQLVLMKRLRIMITIILFTQLFIS